ncbi:MULTISPECIES: AI-2E family transporter [Sphingobium]|uniref:AI-2E family transporter n=1 Tax=Sphingobium fuliginis (strain ATCC 27551) TaxID=336203 RepID=A0ABQ1ERF1_SPHSA|nr:MULTISPECIES: AI-2E family transporter [Sphingobium]OAP32861.1 AI-2E family transporter [Sphingobium sp. 20006FA]AJR25802.1 permease [Sphingobium sp. YBL2]KXU32477.1 AI-2E family transporter [Sphingobium sp. AM]KYC32534.1 AI-2E family transporter [Sphingobium sp. 22B]MCB4862649.1 AI-2E family transporter [Sphingobium sp. PNB]
MTPQEQQEINRRRDRLLASIALTTGIGLVLALPFALREGAEFFLPLTAALVIAIALVPFLEWMERRRVPSALAALMAVIAFLLVANTALVLIVVPAADWFRLLPERLPQIQNNLAPLIDFYSQLQRFVDETVQMLATGPVAAAQTAAVDAPRSLLQFAATSAPAAIIQMVFALLIIYFFLAGWTRLRRRTINSRGSFDGAMAVARVIQNVVDATSAYVLTIATINLCLGLAVALALWLIGMPSPLMWGGIVALLNFVPYFGPMLAAALLALGGLMVFDDVWKALLPAALQVGFHLVEANVITPTILGRRLTMNPLLILVSLTFWGWVWGTPGALLGVPLLIIIQTVVSAAGTPDIAGFLFERGTLTVDPRKENDESRETDVAGS